MFSCFRITGFISRESESSLDIRETNIRTQIRFRNYLVCCQRFWTVNRARQPTFKLAVFSTKALTEQWKRFPIMTYQQLFAVALVVFSVTCKMINNVSTEFSGLFVNSSVTRSTTDNISLAFVYEDIDRSGSIKRILDNVSRIRQRPRFCLKCVSQFIISLHHR